MTTRAVPSSPPGARRRPRHLAALPDRPSTPGTGAIQRLAMHRV
ncbi:hypothetical protein SXIM_08100 [Streptomyces xiamenensis]|uniref:Uncharacterized protein n=1 Tax=Streptomyces xiamenensis TaxID=408015 RepID=A0A0F7FRQ2_9ACTN|nr:hypothetical protein SXIM_08100 [Streptomyces xiamenensis]